MNAFRAGEITAFIVGEMADDPDDMTKVLKTSISLAFAKRFRNHEEMMTALAAFHAEILESSQRMHRRCHV